MPLENGGGSHSSRSGASRTTKPTCRSGAAAGRSATGAPPGEVAPGAPAEPVEAGANGLAQAAWCCRC